MEKSDGASEQGGRAESLDLSDHAAHRRFAAAAMDEYQVKAAFLYNFARFVEWPADVFHDPSDPFAICVLGQDPFGHALDDVVAGKKIEGRAFAVRRISAPRQAVGCRILFVSSSEPK